MALPAALITDLDGTLLLRDRPVAERIVAAGRRWLATGRPLIVATARGPGSAAAVLGELADLCTCGVFHTGALGRAPGFEAEALVPGELVTRICALTAERRPDAIIGLSHPRRGMAVSRELPGDAIADWGVDPGALRDFAVASTDDACKLTIWSPGMPPLYDLSADIERILAGAVDCHPADAGACLLVTSHGVSKASMLIRLLDHLALDPRDCCAIGDDITDVPLLALVGRPVAIIGGHQAVCAQTSICIAGPQDGGWADFVDGLLAATV